MTRAKWVATIALPALLAASACSGDPPDRRPLASGAVLVAATRTIEAGTSKVAMNGTITAGGMSFGMTGEGAFDFRTQNGSMKVTLKGSEIPEAFGGFDLLFVDRVLFMKFPPQFSEFVPGLKPWIKMDLTRLAEQSSLPGFGSFTSQDPTSALTFLRGAMDVKSEGRETVRGEVTTRYSLTVDVAAAGASLSEAERAGWADLVDKTGLKTFPMNVWLDEQGRARRMQFTMTVADLGSIGGEAAKGQKGTLSITTDLYEFGTGVTVSAPPPDQVSPYADLAKLAGG